MSTDKILHDYQIKVGFESIRNILKDNATNHGVIMVAKEYTRLTLAYLSVFKIDGVIVVDSSEYLSTIYTKPSINQ